MNILLVFDQIQPPGCIPTLLIDGNPPLHDAGLGFYYPIGDLVVSTPAPGNNYSDTMMLPFTWSGCAQVRVWAFADQDYDLIHDGGECFSAYSHDLVVPVTEPSWSEIKEKYQN